MWWTSTMMLRCSTSNNVQKWWALTLMPWWEYGGWNSKAGDSILNCFESRFCLNLKFCFNRLIKTIFLSGREGMVISIDAIPTQLGQVEIKIRIDLKFGGWNIAEIQLNHDDWYGLGRKDLLQSFNITCSQELPRIHVGQMHWRYFIRSTMKWISETNDFFAANTE